MQPPSHTPPARPIYLSAPERKWERTGNYTSEGKLMWASREWLPGERLEYIRTVLNREPYLGR